MWGGVDGYYRPKFAFNRFSRTLVIGSLAAIVTHL